MATNHHNGPTGGSHGAHVGPIIQTIHTATTNGTNNQRVQSEKQFKCDFCDKTFTQRRNQRAHIRTVHEKLKPFQCTHCGLTANRKFNLLSHIKKMHGTTEGTSVIDTRISGGGGPAPAPAAHAVKAKKAVAANPGVIITTQTQNHTPTVTVATSAPAENLHQQCLVCSAPVKIAVNKYFCDKCEPRFTAPATSANYLSNVQGRNFNSPAAGAHRPPTQNPQTFKCLQCPFVTEDSSAMIGHHLHAHSSYPMPM